ncbi:MAG: hypothetical protein KJ063_24170 [Anaerolineae bacterium]|nr:hypothetical protein [Anaerolineae bacterium]
MNYRIVATMLILYGYFLVACTSTPSITKPLTGVAPLTALENATIQPRPEFINTVFPKELEIIASDMFERKICVDLLTGPLIQPNDHLSYSDIYERMSLTINGEYKDLLEEDNIVRPMLATDEVNNMSYPAGPFWSCWRAILASGIHEVKFSFRQTSGDVKEYTWYFELSE